MLSLQRGQLQKENFSRVNGVHGRVHAKELDRRLGYKIPRIEVKLQQKYRAYDTFNDQSNRKQHFTGGQTWIGLHPQVLQTPYNDIFEALDHLSVYEIDSIVDIGAAYGRVGLVASVVFPEASFKGYELVKKRQVEGNRIYRKYGLENCNILHKNVLEDDFVIPDAQIYFIYDFSEWEDIYDILNVLSKRVEDYDFFLVFHGDRIESIFKNKFKNIWKRYSDKRFNDLNIYCSKGFKGEVYANR
jgi:tRNA G46 methylase TrmB